MSRTLRRMLGMAAGTALLVTGIALPGSAATPVAHHGDYGEANILDTKANPGAGCRFEVNGSIDFAGVRVRAPQIYAEDRTAHVDHQKVGWRIILLAKQSGNWTAVKRGPVQTAQATDGTLADLSPMTLHYNGDSNTPYRARVKLLWFRPGHPGQVRGWVTEQIEHYRDPIIDETVRSCVGGDF